MLLWTHTTSHCCVAEQNTGVILKAFLFHCVQCISVYSSSLYHARGGVAILCYSRFPWWLNGNIYGIEFHRISFSVRYIRHKMVLNRKFPIHVQHISHRNSPNLTCNILIMKKYADLTLSFAAMLLFYLGYGFIYGYKTNWIISNQISQS